MLGSVTLPDTASDPDMLTDPVFQVSVTIISCTVSPNDEDFSKYSLPSFVLMANSPNSNCVVVGTFPATELLRNFIFWAISMVYIKDTYIGLV
jgi:hypothetical protein